MTKGSIKLAIKALDGQIAYCNETIEVLTTEKKEIQAKCLHDEGYEDVVYSWAPGHDYPAKQCKICGAFEFPEFWEYSSESKNETE